MSPLPLFPPSRLNAPSAVQGLSYGPLETTAVHLCVDMQSLFDSGGPWETPWFRRVIPRIVQLTHHRPEFTVFTRFLPVKNADQAAGTWRRYYLQWEQITLDRVNPSLLELTPELQAFVPPAMVFDKHRYSPWWDGRLHALLRDRGVDTVILSGGETDVCVLATAFGAVDLGYRVILAADALCSSADQTHDAAITLYSQRLSLQLEVAPVDEVLAMWK